MEILPIYRIFLRCYSKSEWLPASIISFAYICAAVSINGISIVLILGIALFTIRNLIIGKYKISRTFLLIVFFVLCIYLLSFIRLDNNEYVVLYLERFLLYDILALFIGLQRFNYKDALHGTCIIGMILLPLIMYNDYLNDPTGGVAMGASYACLPILMTGIVSYSYARSYIYKAFILILISGILYKYFTMANRGIWLILIIMTAIVIYAKILSKVLHGLKSAVSVILVVSFFLSSLVVFQNFQFVIGRVELYSNQFLNSQPHALSKMVYYMNKDNLTNGREEIYILAYKTALENPVIGNGIGYFEAKSDGRYSHNILLQSACEGGVIFIIPLILYLVCIIAKLLIDPVKKIFDSDSYKWNTMIFISGIGPLLFSSCYWLYPLFWFYLGVALEKKDCV